MKGVLAVFIISAGITACGTTTPVSTAVSTPPVTVTNTIAPTESKVLTPTATLAPTATPMPTESAPFSTPTPVASVAPTSSPNQTIEAQPTPTLSPTQNLLGGLSWNNAFNGEFEVRAVSAISAIAGMDIDQGRYLAGSDWVADGINSYEASALEALANIAAADVELGSALTRLEWLDDPLVASQTKSRWLESFLALAPFPDASRTIASWPWVLSGPNSDRRVTQRNLALIAESGSPLLALLVAQSWLHDDITANEAYVVQELAELDAPTALTLFQSIRFSGSVSDAQANLVYSISTIANNNPSLLTSLLELEWVKDGLSKNDEAALSLMDAFSGPTATALAAIPWFANGPTSEREIDAIKAMVRLDIASPTLSVQMTNMPFFRDSLELHDISAVDAIKTLNGDPEDWALLSKQSWYKDGISDEEAVVITVLPGQARNVPTDYQSLVDNMFYLESTTITLPFAGDVDLYLVRFLEQSENSGTMQHLRMAVPMIEDYMGFALPVDEIIMLFSTNVNAGGVNYGTHFTLDVSSDAAIPQLLEGGIVHEITHFYRLSDKSWLGEGTANFLATYVGFELYNQEIAPRSNRSSCPGDVTNITEIEAAYPGYYPEPIAHRFCYHSYGEKIIRGLEVAMGTEPFKVAWRDLFKTGTEGNQHFTDEEIYGFFIKHTPADKIAAVTRVFERYHGGDFLP